MRGHEGGRGGKGGKGGKGGGRGPQGGGGQQQRGGGAQYQQVPQAIPQAAPIPQAIPQAVPQAVPQAPPQGAPQRAPQGTGRQRRGQQRWQEASNVPPQVVPHPQPITPPLMPQPISPQTVIPQPTIPFVPISPPTISQLVIPPQPTLLQSSILQQPAQVLPQTTFPQTAPQQQGGQGGQGGQGRQGGGGRGGRGSGGGGGSGGRGGGSGGRGGQGGTTGRGSETKEVGRRGEQRREVSKYPLIRLVTNMFRANKEAVDKVASMVGQYEIVIQEIITLNEAGEPIPRKPREEETGKGKEKGKGKGKDESGDKPPKSINVSQMEKRELVLEISRKLNVLLVSNGKSTIYSLGSLEEAINRSLSLEKGIENLTLSEKAIDSTTLLLRRNNQTFVIRLNRQNWEPPSINREGVYDEKQLPQMLQVAVQFSFFVKAKEQNRKCSLSPGNMFMDDAVQLFNEQYSDLMLLRGIFQSFRFNANILPMVNIDVAYFPAMRDDISVFDILSMHASDRRKNLAQALQHFGYLNDMNEMLRGTHVITTYDLRSYRLGNDKKPILDGKKTARNTTFKMRGDTKLISVLDYMTNVKGLTVRYPDQPVFLLERRKEEDNIYLLPEFLHFRFGESRDVDGEETSTMIKMTRNEPAERFRLIDQSAEAIRNLEYWRRFGIEILTKYEVDGKTLPGVQVTYSNATVMPKEGSWNLDGKKLLETPAGTINWSAVYPQSRFNQTDVMVKNLVALAHDTGYNLAQEPVWVELEKETPEAYEQALRGAAAKHKGQDVSFYLIILPDKDKVRYRKIKEVSHTDLGIVTQCVALERSEDKKGKISKMYNKSVLANIIAGINPKLQNQNCIITPEQLRKCLGGINLEEMILMGLDVFHGDTNEQKKEPKPSVVALCAATNVHFTKYTFAFRNQIGKKGEPVEVVQELDVMVREVMQEYMKVRKVAPRRILFYRDGVGEKMYEKINDEIEQLMRAMQDICGEANRPLLTFVVVPKRHHLRTFAPSTQNSSLRGNPPPGTLIDHEDVIDKGPDNFYLYTHKALAGTAKPTHYIIVDNANEFSVHELAEFTYALAHLHQGCTKSVSLPVPVFYADRACGVAGECFRTKVDTLHQNLKNSLFMI